MVHTSLGCRGSTDEIKALLARCFEQMGRVPKDRPLEDVCPMMVAYRPALRHALDATFVMVMAILDYRNLDEIPFAKHVTIYEDMDVACRAAVWAIKAQVKLTCYLGLAGDASDGGAAAAQPRAPSAVLLDATLSASRAKDMHPAEGQWKALYGDLLPDDNPRKLTLLRNAVRARATPFTLACLSRYLYKLGDNKAFDLCADALVRWPRSVHANVSYVLMFLSAEACPGKLSRPLAEQCLHRLQRLVPPDCVFVRGLALELHLRAAEESLRAAGDSPASPTTPVDRQQRPVRERAFEPTDHAAVNKALELYCSGDGPWSMVRTLPQGCLSLDPCNCVCSGDCAYLTYRAHGTLLVRDRPLACYSE